MREVLSLNLVCVELVREGGYVNQDVNVWFTLFGCNAKVERT